MERAAKASGLSKSQVYKWGWDRKKKANPNEEGFVKPAKDEFGGYSKHDFAENDADIADLLDIDLNKEIQKLDLYATPSKKKSGGSEMQDDYPSEPKYTAQKKRKVKRREKEVKLSPIKEESAYHQKARTPHKPNIDIVTPEIKRFKLDNFVTPVKLCEPLKFDENRPIEKVKQNLFSSTPSNEDKSFNSKSDKKVVSSSENSMKKKSKSVYHTSDMKCSEVLTPKRLNIQDENFGVPIR